MDVDTPFTIRFSGIVAGTAAAEIDGVLHFSDFLCRLDLRSVFDRSLFGWRRRRDVHQERVVVDELGRSFARVDKIEGEDGYAKFQSLSNALCPLIDGIFGCDEKVYSFVDDRRVLSAEAFDALHDALEGVLFVVALVLRIDRDGHFEIGKRRLLLPRCQQDSSGFHRTKRIEPFFGVAGAMVVEDSESTSKKKDRRKTKILGYTPEEIAKMASIDSLGKMKYRYDDELFPVDLEFDTGLPEPSLGPVLMKMPSQLKEFCKCEYTDLDDPRHLTFSLGPLMGMDIDVIDDFVPTPGPVTDPEAVKLLDMVRDVLGDEEVDVIIEHGVGAGKILEERKSKKKVVDTKKREHAAQGAAWLKNTTYLSNNLHESVHSFKSSSEARADRARIVVSSSDSLPPAYQQAARSFEAAQAPLGDDVEWELPIFPDKDLWANSYVRVDVDGEPPSKKFLTSQIITSEKKIRGQKSLSASVSVQPKKDSDSFEWARQYQLTIRDTATASASDQASGQNPNDRLALFLGEKEATYVVETSKRAELDHSRLPKAALEDRRAADAKNGYAWSGRTLLAHDKRRAFDVLDRNNIRRKLRQVNADISEDEDEEMQQQEDEEDDAAPPSRRGQGDHDDDEGEEDDDDGGKDDEENEESRAAAVVPPPLIEDEEDDA